MQCTLFVFQCVKTVRYAFKTVDQMIANGQYKGLALDFKTCTDLTDKDDRNQVDSFLPYEGAFSLLLMYFYAFL